MAIIRRITVKPPSGGKAQRVIPPDEQTHTGPFQWTVKNLGSTEVDLVDEPTKGHGEGYPLTENQTWSGEASNEEVWAAVASGSSVIVVSGTIRED
jgi:hypothetical protein